MAIAGLWTKDVIYAICLSKRVSKVSISNSPFFSPLWMAFLNLHFGYKEPVGYLASSGSTYSPLLLFLPLSLSAFLIRLPYSHMEEVLGEVRATGVG